MDLSHLNGVEKPERKKAILTDGSSYQISLRDGGSKETDSLYLGNIEIELDIIPVKKKFTKKKK